MDDNATGKRIPVKYIGWGIGDFVEDTIYLHRNLKQRQWRKLKKKILAHEQAHKSGTYGLSDWKNDMKKASYDLEVVLFLSQTPTAWLQFSPFRWYGRGKLYFDRQLLLLYTLMAFTVIVAWNLF